MQENRHGMDSCILVSEKESSFRTPSAESNCKLWEVPVPLDLTVHFRGNSLMKELLPFSCLA